ncbi:hypothetical protein DQ384_30355 [Sphaerisporangium album]|uniref:CBM6 domain-containing protein n=1 Tax=Sphaerisporangium album TaxID=509200 RepID=A0A367F7E1_9ACTN|nr:hypothetical protein DQ384_30355 [Sphaerisporangium album]
MAPGTSHTFTVRARDAAGNVSAASAPVTATTTPGGTVTEYQAEDATLSQAGVFTNHTGYTGTGFVDYVNTTGGYIEWTVDAASAGPVTVAVRYANGTSSDRPMDLAVNGTVAAPGVVFTPTANWDTWTTRTLTLTLAAGVNKIRATATQSNGGPNVDKITVTG